MVDKVHTEKTDLAALVASKPDTQTVLPRTLVIKPMEYKQGTQFIYFSGVFGRMPDSKDDDVWCATFYDRNEAESWLLGCKTFGQAVHGIRLTLKTKEAGKDDAARVEGGSNPLGPAS
jgi:hypothetical protein